MTMVSPSVKAVGGTVGTMYRLKKTLLEEVITKRNFEGWKGQGERGGTFRVEETAQKSGSDMKVVKWVGEIPQEDTAQWPKKKKKEEARQSLGEEEGLEGRQRKRSPRISWKRKRGVGGKSGGKLLRIESSGWVAVEQDECKRDQRRPGEQIH